MRLDAVIETIGTRDDFRNLDVLAVQEASVHHGRPDAETLASVLGPGYDCFQATAQRRRGREQANALIWKRGALSPTGGPEVVRLPGAADVRVRRLERTLLRAAPAQSRIAVCADFESLRMYVVHLDVIGFAHKLEQFKAVLNHLAQRPRVPLTLVAGDLNTFGPSRPRLWRQLAATARAAGLVNVTAAVRRTHWTGQKLDAIYALASGPIGYRAWTVKAKASDHLPVFADIELLAT